MFAGTLGSQECRNAAICASTETSGNPAHRGVHLRVAHGNEDAVALDQFGEPGVQLPGEDHLKAVEHGVGDGRVADVARVAFAWVAADAVYGVSSIDPRSGLPVSQRRRPKLQRHLDRRENHP